MEAYEQGFGTDLMQITSDELFKFIKDCPYRKLDEKISFMENKMLELTKCPQNKIDVIKQDLKHFKSEFKKKWISACHKTDLFIKRHQNWLNTPINVHSWRAASITKPGRPTKEFENCQPTIIQTTVCEIEIKHRLLMTMVDAKVCNAATNNNSTMRCYICNQTSKDFNKLVEKEDINIEALQFGMSTLHARIRFFESLLHLSYKLPLEKWQARTEREKKIVKETKTIIQKQFREKMGLLVDMPKQGGGNTNDGNGSRRFFSDPETAAEITKIDIQLIKRLSVVLEVISCGFDVDTVRFKEYTMETAQLYVAKYGWHPMTPTLHKVLMHGSIIIESAMVPIGQLSEEAGEARNKYFRKYRSDYSRKFSRVDCMRDVFYRLLLTSDPFISLNRKKDSKKRKGLSQEALELLTFADNETISQEDDDVDQDDDVSDNVDNYSTDDDDDS